MCIVIVSFPDCDIISFENNLSYQAIFLHNQKKSGQKRGSFHHLQRVSLKQIKLFFLEGESVYNLTKRILKFFRQKRQYLQFTSN